MKFTITESKLIATTIEVEANSIEEAERLYNEGVYSGQFEHEELEQWNVIECNTEIDES
jgi:hypothetical protein